MIYINENMLKKLNTGSYSGILGTLERNEADYSTSIHGITPERLEVMDFAIPVWTYSTDLIGIKSSTSTNPQPELDSNSFVTMFTWRAWAGTLTVIALMACVYQCTRK